MHAHATPTQPPRVAIVDACSLTRATFHIAYPGLAVTSTHTSAEDLLNAKREPVDVVVLDLTPHHTHGCSTAIEGPLAVRELAKLRYQVCVYTAEKRPLILAECLQQGARGIALKSDPLETSMGVFLSTALGKRKVAPSLRVPLNAIQRRGGPPQLTKRQRQVLQARARGNSWQEIAEHLHISPKTAYDHLEAVRAKLMRFTDVTDLPPGCATSDLERAIIFHVA